LHGTTFNGFILPCAGVVYVCMLAVISNIATTALHVCIPPVTCVVGNAVGHVSAVPVANGIDGLLCTSESPVATNIPFATSVSLAAAVWSVVHDDVGCGVVVGACAVSECAATGVTGAPLMHISPVTSNVPSTESVPLAAAATSVFGNDVGRGVAVRAHESPVATTTPFDASTSLAAATLSAIVDDDVGGGAIANDVIKATNTSFSASLSFAAAL